MNEDLFSAFFQSDAEVLLMDGMCMRVLRIENQTYDSGYVNQLPHI